MKKILTLSILICAAFFLRAQSRIGNQLVSKESVIMYLVEQEKLAHDLYRVLDTLWVTNVFNRMANEESEHMRKLCAVAAEFDIAVPAHFNEFNEGQFVDVNLRDLYADLLMTANFSLKEAYRACANLEERKILDLKAALKEPNFDLETLTYKALLIGAEENFKFLIRTLVEMDGGYTPLYITLSEFEALTKNILPNDGWRLVNPDRRNQARIGLF